MLLAKIRKQLLSANKGNKLILINNKSIVTGHTNKGISWIATW